MDLPETIAAYFAADRRNDGPALAGLFAADAVVHDEGHAYQGHEEIAGWWRDAKAKYQHSAEPLGADPTASGATVRARVSGNFPGSPATLQFRFGLKADSIVRLEIGA